MSDLLLPLHQRPIALHLGIGFHGPEEVKTYRFELWCIHFYDYHGQLYLDGEALPIRPESAGLMPPGAASVTHFPGPSRHAYGHFLFAAPEESPPPLVPIPAMQRLGEDFAPLSTAFEAAIAAFGSHPRRAEVRLWDVLWALAERTPASVRDEPRHPVLERALQRIEERLPEPVGVAALSQELEVSHNHLTRLFRTALKTTVVGYIQRRRIERARYLLVHSTLPIKSIAAEVGLPDLNHFNKSVRRQLGASPRQVRARREV